MSEIDESEITTIKVQKTTHERLTSLGKKDQTYNSIIQDLLETKEKIVEHVPKLKTLLHDLEDAWSVYEKSDGKRTTEILASGLIPRIIETLRSFLA